MITIIKGHLPMLIKGIIGWNNCFLTTIELKIFSIRSIPTITVCSKRRLVYTAFFIPAGTNAKFTCLQACLILLHTVIAYSCRNWISAFLFGDNIDHATASITAIQHRTATANNFNFFYIGNAKRVQIIITASEIHGHAVNHNQGTTTLTAD